MDQLAALVFLVPLLGFAPPAAAQVPQNLGALVGSDAEDGDKLGINSVAQHGEYLLLGADRHDGVVPNGGAVYIFKRDGVVWSEELKLVPGDIAAGWHFGYGVAVYEDIIAVSATRDSNSAGGVGRIYIFHKSGLSWVQETSFQGSDTQAGDHFGASISMVGPYLLVGAPEASVPWEGAGAAYLFERLAPGNWVQRERLVAPFPIGNANFGASVAIDWNSALVGSPYDFVNDLMSGATHAYTRIGSQWFPDSRIAPNDGQALDRFGASVAIDSPHAIIGAWGDDDLGGNSGSAYVFHRSEAGWAEQSKFVPVAPATDDQFGTSVAIRGDFALVGAQRNDDYGGTNAGAAHLFIRNGNSWVPYETFAPSDIGVSDQFGTRVALGAQFAAISAPLRDGLGSNRGAAYAYWIDQGDCNENGTQDSIEIQGGALPDCNDNGRPDLCDIDLGVASDHDGNGVPDECQALAVDTDFISMSQGGTQTLTMRSDGALFGGKLYLVLGSVSGVVPGFDVHGFTIPLNYDWYTDLSASKPNGPPFQTTIGFVDSDGNASAAIQFPPGSPAALAGTQAHHAFVLVDFFSDKLEFTSNTMPLLLGP